MNIAVLFGSFILMMALSVPVGYAIGIATFITLSCFSNIPVALITQNAITGCDSFPLMAIPFFMLAGNLMSSGGIAKRIVDFADTLLGWIQGGLCIVTTIACMFFAAISGSAMATTSAIGGFMIPGNGRSAVTAGRSARPWPLRPEPSVLLFLPVFPLLSTPLLWESSISDLFMAGIVPGILMGVVLIIVSVFRTGGENVSKGERPTFREGLGVF